MLGLLLQIELSCNQINDRSVIPYGSKPSCSCRSSFHEQFKPSNMALLILSPKPRDDAKPMFFHHISKLNGGLKPRFKNHCRNAFSLASKSEADVANRYASCKLSRIPQHFKRHQILTMHFN